jgi:hypothetical protein
MSTPLPACLCCGADCQVQYPALVLCGRCVSGKCLECRKRLQERESAPRQVCQCCGADRQFQHRALPFCSRCVCGKCPKCRSWVRVSIAKMDPKAINLIGRSPGPRMLCGWGCGAKLTTSQMRRHFTDCPRRPRVVGRVSQVPPKPNQGGRPPGPLMLCGWHCGVRLTATKMRSHFAQCRRRPKVSVGGVFL